ncbi:MAG TPA: Fe-S cluster assembly protein HesB [Methanoregulaceae archaeon]|nr:Fe-S cluster assembly protein HesB [Methanoregulaceae archaeon]
MSASGSSKCERIVRVLSSHYGKIPWWPGDTDEVLIGAVLTQQTRWENVEQALLALKERNMCTLSALHGAEPVNIEDAIRCTGFYRVKTKRLKELAQHITEQYGGIQGMNPRPTQELRRGLLGVYGIGAETADSILCYGFNRTSFVIDAYTRRICICLGIVAKGEELKDLFEHVLPEDNSAYRQTHAHIVEYAKEFCGKNRCEECILKNSGE